MAFRKVSDIHRGSESNISAAVRSGVASWGIEEEALLKMRSLGVKFVGVLCRDTGDKYVTRLDHFFVRENVRNYSTFGGALKRYLPLSFFRASVSIK